MILVLEMIAVFLIALGVFYISLPVALIFIGLSMLAFTLAWARPKKADKNCCCQACLIQEASNERSRSSRCSQQVTDSNSPQTLAR